MAWVLKRCEQVPALALVTILAAACTDFEPGSDVLLDETLEAGPAPPGERWDCVANDVLQGVPSTPGFAGARVIFSQRILDLSTGAVYPDLEVRACGISDIGCTTPVAAGLTVDAEGWVDIPLFEGFDGFFEFRSPSIQSSMYFLSEPLEEQMRSDYPFGVVSRDSVAPLIQLVGFQQRPDSGILVLRAFDCTDTTARNVRFEIDGEGVPFYFINGLPRGSATATDSAGLGGFGDVPAGSVVVGATLEDGTPIMVRQNVLVRPGWISVLVARPPRRLLTPLQ